MFGDREAMDDVLQGAERELRESGVDVISHVRRGDPAASLMDVAQKERARLIMLGARGETSAAQLLLGSVSATVAAHAPCDVMIVRDR